MEQYLIWSRTAGQCASDLVKVVHQLNDIDLPDPDVERYQRRLIAVSLVLWELQGAMETAHAVNGFEAAATRPWH